MRSSLLYALVSVLLLALVVPSVFADPGLQSTGVLHFTDSAWDTIGVSYTAGIDSAYLELKDEDADSHVILRDSVLVLVRSELGDGETIYLRETGVSTAVFRGAIAFDLQANRFVSWLKEKYPDGLGSGEEADSLMAREKVAWGNTAKKQVSASDDGRLQVAAGNLLTATYVDPLNDWGMQEIIRAKTIYGGWEGHVSGIWTPSENPYVVVGDLVIGQGYSLILEAGVQVKFMRGVSLEVYGGASFIIRGTETDSVYLTSFREAQADSDFWAGIYVSYGYSGMQGRLSIDRAVISNAERGFYGGSYDTLELSHSHFTHCGSTYWYDCPAIDCGGPARVTSCTVDSCFRGGISISGSFAEVRGTAVLENTGFGIESYCTDVTIEDVTVRHNTDEGIIVYYYYSPGEFRINHCRLYDNGTYDLSNYGSADIDARFNWWGPVTTAEINLGGNPKNLTRIWDGFDNYYSGLVRYGGCDGCPVPGSDGTLAFTDSYGDEIGEYYPPGTDSVHLLLADADLNTNPAQVNHVDVSVTSQSGDNETIHLHETAVNSGVFLGALSVDLQAPKFLDWLREEYPDGLASVSADEANDLIRDKSAHWTTQYKGKIDAE